MMVWWNFALLKKNVSVTYKLITRNGTSNIKVTNITKYIKQGRL